MSSESNSLSANQREELRDFYAEYMTALDDENLERWPQFFCDGCVYQIIPRENHAQGLALCTIQADSKEMLLDRVQGILKTQKFSPRQCRRFFSGLTLTPQSANVVNARQNVLVVQTLIDEPSNILLCGVAHDRLVNEDGRWHFLSRVVVSDTEVLQEAFIFPI